MRARALEVAAGLGGEFGVEHGLVGIGDALDPPPTSLDDAVESAIATHGAKTGRMLARFAELPDGTFVWTRTADGAFHLGRIRGPWRYDDSPAARAVGIHHVRDAEWLDRPFGPDEVPPAVAATFERGGPNLQRTHSDAAERRTAELWDSASGASR